MKDHLGTILHLRNFTRPDELHFQAALGWLGLGDVVSASNELEEITPELRAHPDVLKVRCEIYSKAKKWDHAATVAEALVKILPDEPRAWIQRSFALHEMKRTQEALDKLLPVTEKFPDVCTIPYNLACYSAQLGRLDECQAWFKKAMAIDEHTVKRAAIDDPDLKPLWDSMSGTLWRRIE